MSWVHGPKLRLSVRTVANFGQKSNLNLKKWLVARFISEEINPRHMSAVVSLVFLGWRQVIVNGRYSRK